MRGTVRSSEQTQSALNLPLCLGCVPFPALLCHLVQCWESLRAEPHTDPIPCVPSLPPDLLGNEWIHAGKNKSVKTLTRGLICLSASWDVILRIVLFPQLSFPPSFGLSSCGDGMCGYAGCVLLMIPSTDPSGQSNLAGGYFLMKLSSWREERLYQSCFLD